MRNCRLGADDPSGPGSYRRAVVSTHVFGLK